MALVVLAAGGLFPVVGLVGLRWWAVFLCPLGGAVVAAVATTCCLGIGGRTMTWFVTVSALGAAGTIAGWWWRPDHRPWRSDRPSVPGSRVTGIVAVVAVVGACAWCLRTLSTPTVGFDTRAIWLMRAGWFLQPHHQLVADMSSPGIFLTQTSYPPLVSAAAAVGWDVTGNHSMRLGVVVIALLNACALAAGALAVVECGRLATGRLWRETHSTVRRLSAETPGRVDRRSGALLFLPSAVGVVGAVALVFVTFAVTEPFMSNGYADPLWSLAAVGAVAYGLQMESGRSAFGAAGLLAVVAGMSKDEGAATAALLIGLLVVRGVVARWTGPRRLWWRPVAAGLVGLAFVAAWPVTVHLLHLRAVHAGGAPLSQYLHRARQAVDGLAPYLHVVVLAAAMAVVGCLVLTPVRRAVGMGNDGWGWAGLAAGSAVILGAYVTGTADVASWLTTTAHRVTEFTALSGWWIVALWAVTGSAGPGASAAGALAPRQGRWATMNQPASSRAASTVRPASVNHHSSSDQMYLCSTGALSRSKVSRTRLRKGLSR